MAPNIKGGVIGLPGFLPETAPLRKNPMRFIAAAPLVPSPAGLDAHSAADAPNKKTGAVLFRQPVVTSG